MPFWVNVTDVLAIVGLLNVTGAGPEYSFHRIGALPLGSTTVALKIVLNVLIVWSAPAFTVGAPGERGPSAASVLCTTSKLLTSIVFK